MSAAHSQQHCHTVSVRVVGYEEPVRVARGAPLASIEHRLSPRPIRFGCRRGACGKCAVLAVCGAESLGPLSGVEAATLEILGLSPPEHRLACMCTVLGDVTVDPDVDV